MPTWRTYRRRRRSAWRRRARPAYRTKIAGEVVQDMPIEMKWHDVGIDWTWDDSDPAHQSWSPSATRAVPATGEYDVLLSAIPYIQTEPDVQRTGRKIAIKSINVHMTVNREEYVQDPIIGDANQQIGVRIMLVWAKNTCGTTQQLQDILQDHSTALDLMDSFNDLGRKHAYTVLKDWRIYLPAITNTWYDGVSTKTQVNQVRYKLDYYKKCYLPINFQNEATDVTSQNGNSLWLLAACEYQAAKTAVPNVTGTIRLRFIDL